jgi:hypothetical protein
MDGDPVQLAKPYPYGAFFWMNRASRFSRLDHPEDIVLFAILAKTNGEQLISYS